MRNPHRVLFSRHPLAQLAIAFAAGVCAANYFSAKFVLLFAAGVGCSLAALMALLQRRFSPARLALLAAMVLAGATLAVEEKRVERHSGLKRLIEEATISPGTPLVVTGMLDGPPEFARDRLYLTLRVERISDSECSGVLSLLAPFKDAHSADEFRSLQLRHGARIRVVTTLTRADNYRNPGVSPLSEYLERKGYDAAGTIRSSASITRLNDTSVFPPLARLYAWREKLQREIDSKFAPETAGVLAAALLGNRHNLSRETAERFREGGTFHVLVISGLHISFIGAVVLLAVRRLSKNRLVQFVVPLAVVWGYSFAVGAEASVVRAALMFTFAGLAVTLFRQSSSLNALGGAALVLLSHRPKELFDSSFQLTFLCVLAIVACAWPMFQTMAAIGRWRPTRETPYPPACSRSLRQLCQVLFWSEREWKKEIARSSYHYRLFTAALAVRLEQYHLQRCLRYLTGAMLVSVAVQVVLLPLMIFYFHRLSLSSLLLNIVVSVLLAILIAVALAALLVSQVSTFLSAPLIKFAETINWVMVHSVDPFSSFNLASIRLPEYSGWAALVYLVYYVPLFVIMLAIARWRPLVLHVETRSKWVAPAVVAQGLLLALLLFHPFSGGFPEGKLRVDFLDVGQGDCVLITMPDRMTLLVDGGGRPSFGAERETRSIGEAVVSEYLWWRGLDTVDYVLATHADADHLDGLNDVLRNFSVKGVFVARQPANDPEYAKFSQTLSATSTRVETIQAGDVIRFGDVAVQVLWPRGESEASDVWGNNDSVVLRLRFGQRSILFTGDIEKSAESALVAASLEELRADVVKVPHHGSRTSSTPPFVAATQAKFAIVSAGRRSMFGHPHAEVVERWRASGAEVLTTGECGMISVVTDGRHLGPQEGTECTKGESQGAGKEKP